MKYKVPWRGDDYLFKTKVALLMASREGHDGLKVIFWSRER